MSVSMRLTAAMVLVTALVLGGAGRVQAQEAGKAPQSPPVPRISFRMQQ